MNLLCHLPLFSIFDDKFNPHLFFNPVSNKNFDPRPTSSLDPPTYKKILTPTSIFTIRSLVLRQLDPRRIHASNIFTHSLVPASSFAVCLFYASLRTPVHCLYSSSF